MRAVFPSPFYNGISPTYSSTVYVDCATGCPCPTSRSSLHAAIHLAHKYQCPEVETRGLSVLKRYYTPHFTDYVRYSTSRPTMSAPPRGVAVGAVNIAPLTETVSMLPFALYHVCTLEGCMMDGYKRRHGTVEYLSAEDLKLCVGARNTLAKEMSFFVKAVFTRTSGARCKTAERCTQALVNICESRRRGAERAGRVRRAGLLRGGYRDVGGRLQAVQDVQEGHVGSAGGRAEEGVGDAAWGV